MDTLTGIPLIFDLKVNRADHPALFSLSQRQTPVANIFFLLTNLYIQDKMKAKSLHVYTR